MFCHNRGLVPWLVTCAKQKQGPGHSPPLDGLAEVAPCLPDGLAHPPFPWHRGDDDQQVHSGFVLTDAGGQQGGVVVAEAVVTPVHPRCDRVGPLSEEGVPPHCLRGEVELTPVPIRSEGHEG